MLRHTVAFLLVVLIMIAAVRSTTAQVLKGQILGSVTDSSGAVILNATVTLADVTRGVQTSRQTSEDGNYAFVNLDPGSTTSPLNTPGSAAEFATTSISSRIRRCA